MTPSPSEPDDLTPSEWRAEILRLTNIERTNDGLSALSAPSPELAEAAGIRAHEISTKFDHDRPDGSKFFTVLAECGVSYRAAGENIAMATAGYLTPAQVVKMWMDSSGHRDNILSSNYTSVGIGYYESGGHEWFVQLFIG